LPEYLEPNSNIFTDPNVNDPTAYPSNDGRQTNVAASEFPPIHCPCTVPGCTGIQHIRSYSGLDVALTVECKKNECAYKSLVHNISAEISSNHMK
jgi:hypothetical protein